MPGTSDAMGDLLVVNNDKAGGVPGSSITGYGFEELEFMVLV
jgi:hypothetical protein